MENSIVVAIDTYNVPTGGNTNMLDPDVSYYLACCSVYGQHVPYAAS